MPIACQKSYIYLLKIPLKHMDLIIWTMKSLAAEKCKKLKPIIIYEMLMVILWPSSFQK